jgi:hypothetical protein
MKAYVFYSGATRKTGEAICEELSKIKNVEASSGDTIPKERVDLVIGWGAKTKKEVKMKTKHSINHPNCIMSNRDKFNFLSIMKNNKIPVASFVSSGKIQNELKSNKTDMKLPLVGRTNYHQGGQGFWLCLTASQVAEAIKEGAQYFQNYIPIATEYRMHVFKGEVFYAHKKVKHDNPRQAFVEDYIEKVKAYATQNKQSFDEDTANMVLNRLSERNSNPNPVLRSHMNGWKFSSLKDKELSTKTVKDLCDIAVKATQALDLSFSAVDCAIDEDGNPYVIELNTGPGVTGKTFDKWVEQFKNYIDTLTKPAKEDTKNVSKDKSTAKDDASKDKNAKSGKKQSTIDKINTLQSKFDYIKSLIANADSDEEADIILKAASKDVDIEAAAGAKFFG